MEDHNAMDVSKSLHLIFDQGAFKDMDLQLKWPRHVQTGLSYSVNLSVIARYSQGWGPLINKFKFDFFHRRIDSQRFGQGQESGVIYSQSTIHPLHQFPQLRLVFSHVLSFLVLVEVV